MNLCIKEIKSRGFVETNTPIWNSLMGFENSISWYNSVQSCIKQINYVIYWKEYFIINNLSALKQRKINLTDQNCRQSKYKLSELNNAYENLKNRSYSYLSTKLEQYDTDFNTSEKRYYKTIAYQKYDELRNEIEDWNTVFDNSSELNTQLQNYKTKIDYYYY